MHDWVILFSLLFFFLPLTRGDLSISSNASNAPSYELLQSVFGLPTLMCKSFDVCGKHTTPQITRPIGNISAEQGNDVTFTCRIADVGKSKLAWVRMNPKPMLIGWQTTVFRSKSKYRISLREGRQYSLRIKHVQASDAGGYMCQINTSPMVKQTGYLVLKVPPQIRKDIRRDVSVQEGYNTSLVCIADGSPAPTYTWTRDPVPGNTKPLIYRYGIGKGGSSSVSMQNLSLTHVRRDSSGPYKCYASNGILPIDVWTIHLTVHFVPTTIAYPSPVVGAEMGSSVVLRCKVEASPRAAVTWRRTNPDMYIFDNDKFTVTPEIRGPMSAPYEAMSSLQIDELQPSDFTVYYCGFTNQYGESEAVLTLKEEKGRYMDFSAIDNSLQRDDEDSDFSASVSRLDNRDVSLSEAIDHKQGIGMDYDNQFRKQRSSSSTSSSSTISLFITLAAFVYNKNSLHRCD